MGLVDFIYKVVRQQTNLIGQPVTNLYGAVAGQSPAVLNMQDATWVVATIGATGLPTLAQFYNMYMTSSQRKYQTLKAVEGVVGIAGNISTGSAPTAVLFRGIVDFPGNAVVPLAVVSNGPNNPFAVYLDGNLQRQGSGSLDIALSLSAGRHIIEVVALASEVYVAVPASVRVFYDLDVLDPPVWSSISTSYLDPTTGATGITLSWFNDNRVGGWIVYRRSITYLSTINTVGTPNQYGTFGVELAGDVSTSMSIGDDLVSGTETMGTILAVTYDSLAAVTNVQLQLPTGVYTTNTFWAGRTAATGRFVEQTRFARNSSVGVISWVDSNVVIEASYEYMLQSYGLFNVAQQSPNSVIQQIVAGDITPPGNVTLAAGYPQVFNGVATVILTTPTDTDYDGVQVNYYENPASGTSSGSNTVGTLNDTSKSWTTNQFAGYYILIKSGTGAGQSVLIASNTATQLVLDASTQWNTSYVPDGTSTYDIYKLTNVVTDYGVPNTQDQFTFNTIGEGVYCFMTFDRGLNIQSFLSCTTWTYAATNASVIPTTNAAISNVGTTGQVNSSVLGVSLYSIPQQPELFLDTFTGATGFKLTSTLLTSGTSDASGNTVTTLVKTGAGWTTNAYAGKVLRIVGAGVLQGLQATIQSNTTTVLTLTTNSALPYPPDNIAFQVLDHFPNTIAASVLNTARDRWNVNSTIGTMANDALWFAGTLNAEYTIFLDSAYTGKNTPFRLEAVITRGSTHVSGSNLTYRGNTTNVNRWEFGIVHSSDTVVIPRYRYNSGGKNPWANFPGVNWNRYSSNKLIVELDNDIHTFKFADAYGHNEIILGRVNPGPAGPLDSCIGWNVRGESGGDAIDSIRMLDFSKLVRIRYRLLPDNQNLKVSQYTGKATGGSTTSLNDTTKVWYTNELLGMRVLITAGPGAGSDSLIKSNTATQIVPVTAFSAAPTTASSYMVYDPNYMGTERLQFWTQRNPVNAQTLEFHGERSGVPNEPVNRFLVDANQVPELQLSVSKTATIGSNSEITAVIIPDDDVKFWSLYAKLTGWPTKDGTVTGAIDLAYEKYRMTPISVTSQALQLNDGTWYFIAIPYDSNGSPGPYSSASIVASSGGAVSPTLSNVAANRVGTSNTIRVSWNHPSTMESPDTTYHVDIYENYNDGSGTFLLVGSRRAWADAGSTVALAGSYDDSSSCVFGTKGIDPYHTFTYTIELIRDSDGALMGTYVAYFSFYGSITA